MARQPEAVRMNENDDQWLSELSGRTAVPAAEPVQIVPVNVPKNIDAANMNVPQPMPVAAADKPAESHAIFAHEALAPLGKTESSALAGISGDAMPPMAAPQRRKHSIINTEMPNLGILDQFMTDQEIGDIMVNGVQSIYVDRAGKMVDSGIRFETHEQVWNIAESIVKSVGQILSHDRPMVDTRLPDGSRVNIVAPPMAVDGVSISIRKFPNRQITLETMVSSGQLTPELASFLSQCVAKRMNLIVCGGTGSGKTTLLNALSASIGQDERVVTIEDSAELRLQQKHVVRLESKIATVESEKHKEVTIRDLVKNALRMRPDRIVVGESRGAEALDVLQAMNTGHDGSMTTLHANSPRDALSRLETLVSLAMPQLAIRLVRAQIASTVNLIVNMQRCKDGVRRVMFVSELSGMEGEIIVMQDLVVFTETAQGGQFRWANGSPRNQHVTDAARSSGLMRGIR